jgi:hypothetical protein
MNNRNAASYKSLKRERTEDADLTVKFGADTAAKDEIDFDISDYNEEDQDYIKTIAATSRNLEADSSSLELQVTILTIIFVESVF